MKTKIKNLIVLMLMCCISIMSFIAMSTTSEFYIHDVNNNEICNNKTHYFDKKICGYTLDDVLDGQTTAGYHLEKDYQELLAQATAFQTFGIQSNKACNDHSTNCGPGRENGYSNTFLSSGCRNWEGWSYGNYGATDIPFWINMQSINTITNAVHRNTLLDDIRTQANMWNQAVMHDGTGQIVNLYEVGIGLDTLPDDINGHRVVEINRKDGSYAGQFKAPFPLFSPSIEINFSYDASGAGNRPGRNVDTPLHEMGHLLGLNDLDADLPSSSWPTHKTLMGYSRGTTVLTLGDAITYHDIQGIAVLNNRHTNHQFDRYVQNGSDYLHYCFYCDTIDCRSSAIAGAFAMENASSCVHTYQQMVSLGDKHWLKCTKCYKVIESEFLVQGLTTTSLEIVGFLNNTKTTVSIPSSIGGQSVTSIGASAFENCINLTSVTILGNVQSIGANAFKDCNSLTTFTIPSGLAFIGDNAFKNCNSLANIYIPSGLTSIGNGAFSGCSNLNISVSSGNSNYSEQGNILYNKARSAIIASGKVATSLTISNEIKTINPYAFNGNNNLEIINFDGVTVMGDYAFADCMNLEAVYFNSYTVSVTMGSNCFANTDTKLYVPFNAQDIYKTVFADHSYYVDSIQILITYIDNGSPVGTANFYYGSTITGLPELQKTGYEFNGWYDNDAFIGKPYNNGDLLDKNKNISFYVNWMPLNFDIILDSNGGIITGVNTFKVAYGSSFSTESTATKVGYTLDGWYDNVGVRYLTASGESTRLWDKLENTTLYAHWTIKSYEIQINGNGSITWLGASGLSSVPCTIPYGTLLNAINLVPIFKNSDHGFKEGHIFDHFEYADSNWDWMSIPDLGESGTVITIVPVWIKEVHTIYFNTQCSIMVQYIEKAYDLDIALPSITRSGFVFNGWYTESTAGTKVEWTKMPDLSPNNQNNGSKTLFARWSQIFTVSFNSNGGSTCLMQTGVEGDEITLPISIKGGYKGTWYGDNNLVYNFGSKYVIGTNNVTLTATWQEKSLSECYNSYSSVYEIWTYNQLNSVHDYRNSNHKLMADICVPNGTNWNPISAFYGVFDGNYKTITNLRITIPNDGSAQAYYGLFTINKGTIRNLYMVSTHIYSAPYHDGNTWINVGAIAGSNEGTIEHSRVSGSVTRIECNMYMSRIGGITGRNSGTIRNCNVSGLSLYGNGDIGGIAGASYGGLISYCFAQNMKAYLYIVQANRSIGAIAGYINSGAIVEYCYGINTSLIFDGYSEIAWNAIAPKMGKIVGSMNGSTIRNVSLSGIILDPGSLPEKTNNGSIFNSWYYPRKYIGAFGNGACGNAVNGYTITNTSWAPSSK